MGFLDDFFDVLQDPLNHPMESAMMMAMMDDEDEDEEEDSEWRLFAEDGTEYDLDPEDFETEEEYEEALEEAKHGWRTFAEDGMDYDLDPEDFETEEEYEEALEEAKYGWRDDAEDGSEYDLDPEEFETEKEYRRALLKAKYEWLMDSEDDDLDLDDLEREEEYVNDLEVTLRETEDEFVLSIPIKAELVLTVSGNDSESEEDDSALKDATLEDYLADPETFHEAGYTWKDYVRRAEQYDLDLNDFTDLTEYLDALKKAKNKDE